MVAENDISLKELADIEKMSVRAVNICYKIGLNSLNKILRFYQLAGDFKSVQNCGQRTENELIFICKKYLNGYTLLQSSLELPFIDKTVEIISTFNPFKKAALNRHIDYLFSKLNVRARNGIINLFGNKPNANELIDTIFSKDFNFYGIRNIGEKSSQELVRFKKNISDFTETLQTLDESQLSKEYTRLVIKTSFNNIPNGFDDLLESVFDFNNKIKLFKLIDLLIKSDLLFRKAEKEIFYYSFTYFNNKSLHEIADLLNIGKERLRQIKVNLEDEIKAYFNFILNLQEEDLPQYGIEYHTVFLLMDDEYASNINSTEEVSFTPQFYSFILSLFHEKTHSIFGDNEVLTTKHKLSNSRRFCNCYLIESKIFNSFDFSAFANSVNEILNERINEDYYLHFQGYISQFVKQKQKKDFEEIASICESILFNEFDLVVNADGYLIFERNTKKQLTEYVVEALEELSDMTKVDDIVKKININHPHLETNEQSVRSTLQREKELFIFIGRSSTYGLRKWQEERENLKGGTIRDIVEEYLQMEDEPKHISEITKFVQKYRNTTEYNVKTNLDLEGSVRFQFFPGEFIGLKSKQYHQTDKYKKAIGSHFRNAMFRKMNGWNMDEVINFFVSKFDYHPIQVKSLIEKKISQGNVSITSDNKLII
jgi:hypothetical protein